MNKKIIIIMSVVVFVGFAMYFYFHKSKDDKRAYVGGYSKSASYIYEFDINNKTVIKHTNWLNGVVWSNSLALNREKSLLYIAGQESYGKNVEIPGIDVIDLIKSERINTIPLKGTIYQMVLSPNNDFLYVTNPSYGENNTALTWKIDSETGQVKDKVNLAINPSHHHFVNSSTVLGMSPQVKYLYDLKKDTFVRIIRGKSQIVENGGLNHQDLSFNYPYIEVKKENISEGIVDFYDRKTVEKISAINLSEQIENFRGVADRWPVISPAGKMAFFRGKIGANNSKNALIIIDISKKEVNWVHKFKDKLMDLSNIVVKQ